MKQTALISLYIVITFALFLVSILIPTENSQYLYVIYPQHSTAFSQIADIKQANLRIIGEGALPTSYIIYAPKGTSYKNLKYSSIAINLASAKLAISCVSQKK